MTLLLKRFSKILAVSIIAIFTISCNSLPKEEADNLCHAISQLKGTDYSNFPNVILLYNTTADSIEIVNQNQRLEMNKYIVKTIGEKNDTLMLTAHLLISNPTQMGTWLGEHIVKEAIKKDNRTNQQRSAQLLKKINIARFLYEKSGESSSIKEMELAIDLYINCLDKQTQAKLFTRVSSPEILGNYIANSEKDKDKEELLKEIQKIYSKDEALLNRFNNSINQNNNPINQNEDVKP